MPKIIIYIYFHTIKNIKSLVVEFLVAFHCILWERAGSHELPPGVFHFLAKGVPRRLDVVQISVAVDPLTLGAVTRFCVDLIFIRVTTPKSELHRVNWTKCPVFETLE